MPKKILTKEDKVKQEEDYVAFLRKRLDSENFKNNSTKEEYEKTQRRYDKAKLKLKFLKEDV
jgi:hypothetical protein